MRAAAALGVIFSHLYQRLQVPAGLPRIADLQAVLVHGAYGVSIFFVLSGMLLSFPFWSAYFSGSAMPGLGRYARRRAARIIPAYYASLAVGFAVTPLIAPDDVHTVWRLVAGLTFTSGFHYVTLFPSEVNPPLWSISFEVFSYVVLPIAISGLFWLRSRRKRTAAQGAPTVGTPLRGLGYWAVVLGLAVALNGLLLATVSLGSSVGEHGHIGLAKTWMPGYNPLGFFGHFAIGVLAAWVIASWRARCASAGDTNLVPKPLTRWWWDAVAVTGAVAAALLIWFHRNPARPNSPDWFQGQPYQYPFFALAIAVTLVGLAHSRVVGRIADNRFSRYTATISFGLYVWHFLVVHLFSYITAGRLNAGALSPGEHLAVAGALLVVSYAVATISWRLLEQPALRSGWATRA